MLILIGLSKFYLIKPINFYVHNWPEAVEISTIRLDRIVSSKKSMQSLLDHETHWAAKFDFNFTLKKSNPERDTKSINIFSSTTNLVIILSP